MTHENIHAALAAFQATLPVIGKDNIADVKAKDGTRSFSYRYADLADISPLVLPALAKEGLSWSALPTLTADGRFVLHYQLAHESGETISGDYPLPSANTPAQQLGSAITYARRYALCAVTGVVPGGDDDDAASAQTASPATRTAEPAAWRKTISDARNIQDLNRIYQTANAEGWATPDVMRALTTRRHEIEKTQDDELDYERRSAEEYDAAVARGEVIP